MPPSPRVPPPPLVVRPSVEIYFRLPPPTSASPAPPPPTRRGRTAKVLLDGEGVAAGTAAAVACVHELEFNLKYTIVISSIMEKSEPN